MWLAFASVLLPSQGCAEQKMALGGCFFDMVAPTNACVLESLAAHKSVGNRRPEGSGIRPVDGGVAGCWSGIRHSQWSMGSCNSNAG